MAKQPPPLRNPRVSVARFSGQKQDAHGHVSQFEDVKFHAKKYQTRVPMLKWGGNVAKLKKTASS